MRLFLDCEFNGFQGSLISMALVAEDGQEFYEVLPCHSPVQWVAENVMPILAKPFVSRAYFTACLHAFLAQYETVHIVADWPEDISHFCQSLIVGPGKRINTPPLTLEVVRVDSVSELPHNALCDARGIKNHLTQAQNHVLTSA